MSSSKYARKAQQFVVSNPDADASEAQVKSCNWLLRTREHPVKFGNSAVKLLSDGATRADADRIIKYLSQCPTVKQADVKRDVKSAQDKATAMSKADAAAQIREIARQHKIKLGKVAEKHLATI